MNKKIFSGVLLGVLVFGGSFLVYKGVCMANNSFSEAFVAEGGRVNFDSGLPKYNEGSSIGSSHRNINDVLRYDTRSGHTFANQSGERQGYGVEEGGLGLSAWLVKIASTFLMWTVSDDLYKQVFFSEIARKGITQAWEAVRGFINMFYLLILVFLAITTILRINKFNDKKLFFNVIISAVLVNFSMAITLVVIDFSNLIMTYFASAIQDVNTANSFFRDSGYSDKVLVGGDINMFLKAGAGMVEFIINIVIAVMILFTAISLLIRLIAYWILIILSPLAFFSLAIPGSNGFTEWKDKLIWYSFYGPIMMFFIWLALSLSGYLSDAFAHASGLDGKNGFIMFLTSYITVLYLLYYGHEKSKEMAKKAGDTVGMLMDKGSKYAVTAGKGAMLATGVGAGGYLGYQWAKSRAKSEYTGMKTAMEDGKYGFLGKVATKEGKKNIQDEKDFNAKIRHASDDKRQSLEMQRAEKALSKMKEGGKDIENEDVLVDMLRTGNEAEQQAAALQLSKLGKLGIDSTGNRYTEAKEIVAGNKFLDKAVERGSGDKNKVAVLKHHANRQRMGTVVTGDESKKFFEKQMEQIREAYERKNPIPPTGIAKTDDEIMDDVFGGYGDDEKAKVMERGFVRGLNLNDMATMANEKDGHKAIEYFAETETNPFLEERNHSSHELRNMGNRLNGKARTELRSQFGV